MKLKDEINTLNDSKTIKESQMRSLNEKLMECENSLKARFDQIELLRKNEIERNEFNFKLDEIKKRIKFENIVRVPVESNSFIVNLHYLYMTIARNLKTESLLKVVTLETI